MVKLDRIGVVADGSPAADRRRGLDPRVRKLLALFSLRALLACSGVVEGFAAAGAAVGGG
jgi:hypothetical protein